MGGSGVLVVCGNLFCGDCPSPTDGSPPLPGSSPRPGQSGVTRADVKAAWAAHPTLARAIKAFTSASDSRFIVLAGWRDPEVGTDPDIGRELAKLGIEVAPSVDLKMTTAAGVRTVLVRPGQPAQALGSLFEPAPNDNREWLDGIDRLEDPTASRRFVTSRVLYRRLRRYLFVPPLLLVAIALLLRLNFVFSGLDHVVRSRGGRRVLIHVHYADWQSRLLFTLIIVVVLMVVLAGIVAIVSRGIWKALGGGDLPSALARPRARPGTKRRRPSSWSTASRPSTKHERWWPAAPQGWSVAADCSANWPIWTSVSTPPPVAPPNSCANMPVGPDCLRLPPSSPDRVDRDRDRGRTPRPPALGRYRSSVIHPPRAGGHGGTRGQGLQSGRRRPPCTGGLMAAGRLVAGCTRYCGRPGPGAPSAPGCGGRHLCGRIWLTFSRP